jgi:hypothetical protein
MIRKYSNLSLATGLPGLIIQVVGISMENDWVTLLGSALFFAGLVFYAVGKGRSPAWALLGFLSLLGLLMLACLKDYEVETKPSR